MESIELSPMTRPNKLLPPKQPSNPEFQTHDSSTELNSSFVDLQTIREYNKNITRSPSMTTVSSTTESVLLRELEMFENKMNEWHERRSREQNRFMSKIKVEDARAFVKKVQNKKEAKKKEEETVVIGKMVDEPEMIEVLDLNDSPIQQHYRQQDLSKRRRDTLKAKISRPNSPTKESPLPPPSPTMKTLSLADKRTELEQFVARRADQRNRVFFLKSQLVQNHDELHNRERIKNVKSTRAEILYEPEPPLSTTLEEDESEEDVIDLNELKKINYNPVKTQSSYNLSQEPVPEFEEPETVKVKLQITLDVPNPKFRHGIHKPPTKCIIKTNEINKFNHTTNSQNVKVCVNDGKVGGVIIKGENGVRLDGRVVEDEESVLDRRRESLIKGLELRIDI
jgi:hypothetical protein